ncbi:hypothetical protein LY76DRAFT_342572 [Colletotrichum caudatum]|nr:hypothetical protein LY76DRAFT_342572 [Colletotrichum caudatum]
MDGGCASVGTPWPKVEEKRVGRIAVKWRVGAGAGIGILFSQRSGAAHSGTSRWVGRQCTAQRLFQEKEKAGEEAELQGYLQYISRTVSSGVVGSLESSATHANTTTSQSNRRPPSWYQSVPFTTLTLSLSSAPSTLYCGNNGRSDDLAVPPLY